MAKLKREEVRTVKNRGNKNNKEGPMFISTNDNHANMIKKMITKSWHILQSDTKYACLFHDPRGSFIEKGK